MFKVFGIDRLLGIDGNSGSTADLRRAHRPSPAPRLGFGA
ncbi:hypothetical protein FM103_08210 [Corynebacterium xerosis]|nr:hypothetical protein FM103_08210 [Corynebacterium xerosis]